HVTIGDRGAATVHVKGRSVEWKKPVLYQEVDGQRVSIEGRYRMTPQGELAFEVGRYNPARSLVIDPVVSYASYQGSSFAEMATRVAVDGRGNSYITGVTHDHNLAVTAGAYANAPLHGKNYGFITKFDAATQAVVYSTFIAGSEYDGFSGLAVDTAGNAYLTGMTSSSNYPVTAGVVKRVMRPPGVLPEDISDCIVTKLNPAGNSLVYSTFLGGPGPEYCSSIAIDAQG